MNSRRASSTARLTAEALGAWVVKANPRVSDVAAILHRGCTDLTRCCAQRTYRTDLVAPGQPVLWWVSGGNREVPSGFHAAGETTGHLLEDAGAGTGGTAIPVHLEPLPQPLLRPQVLADPIVSSAEVIRMPFGSNPSFLTVDQWRRVRQLLTGSG